MTAGDAGTILTANTGAFVISPSDPVTMKVQLVQETPVAGVSYAMTVSAQGVATRLTTGVEFPVGGQYLVSVSVGTSGSARYFTSAPFLVQVSPLITP